MGTSPIFPMFPRSFTAKTLPPSHLSHLYLSPGLEHEGCLATEEGRGDRAAAGENFSAEVHLLLVGACPGERRRTPLVGSSDWTRKEILRRVYDIYINV